MLENLKIAAPCNASWDDMEGNDRVRACGQCQKNVYNISDMTGDEAEAFLAENGYTVCMRFYQRADGTIITDNCPVGLRKIRDGVKRLARTAAALVSFVISISAVSAQDSATKSTSNQGSASDCDKSKNKQANSTTTTEPARMMMGAPAPIAQVKMGEPEAVPVKVKKQEQPKVQAQKTTDGKEK
ncbi:MAG TPA: hypothetical protein V6C72_18140 [Chroococcales cyanobacterium]